MRREAHEVGLAVERKTLRVERLETTPPGGGRRPGRGSRAASAASDGWWRMLRPRVVLVALALTLLLAVQGLGAVADAATHALSSRTSIRGGDRGRGSRWRVWRPGVGWGAGGAAVGARRGSPGRSSARRWRLVDLGAGEELARPRALAPVDLAARARSVPPGERRVSALARARSSATAAVAARAAVRVDDRAAARGGPRLPLGDGQHVFLFGATGSGKTTTARRLIAARVLAQRAALLVLDQKGDQEDVEQMRRLAAAAGVPFVLFDSQDRGHGSLAAAVGHPGRGRRPVRRSAIKQSEPYYYDVLRKHLDIVCKVLHAADRWPPSVPFLIDACDPAHYPQSSRSPRDSHAQHARAERAAPSGTTAGSARARAPRISPAARCGSRSRSRWPPASSSPRA